MTPDKSDVLYGTLGLMLVKTLEALGPLHARIARRIEQISGISSRSIRALCPALLRLEQMGWIASRWGIRERPTGEDLHTDARRTGSSFTRKKSNGSAPRVSWNGS